MIRKVMNWIAIILMMMVIVVGFAVVISPSALYAWGEECEHGDQHPHCPSGYHFKYCQWEYYGPNPGDRCCVCSWCVPNQGVPGESHWVCWV